MPGAFKVCAILALLAAGAFALTLQCASSTIDGTTIRASRQAVTCSLKDAGEGVGLEKAYLGEKSLDIGRNGDAYLFTLNSTSTETLFLGMSDGSNFTYEYVPGGGTSLPDVGNATEAVGLRGNWLYVAVGIGLLIATFAIIYLFKHFLANMIGGLIALVALKFLFNIDIPITGLTILVTILGGLGGVGALLIAAVFGWL